MKLKVDSVSVIVTEPEKIVSNAVKTHYCYFEFDETWNEYEKKAEFKRGDIIIEVLLKDNMCAIPWEVLKTRGILKIGVFGVCGDKRRPTLWSENIIIYEGASEGSEEKEPTPSVFEQMVAILAETKSIAQSVRDDADSGLFKGEKGEKGDAGSIKFIPVKELPTDNIDESAFYLVPIENSDGENRFKEYAYVNGAWEPFFEITIDVDHSEYVKFTDYASQTAFGIVKGNTSNGVGVSKNGELYCEPSYNAEIDAKKTHRKPIVPSTLDYAVKVGITTNTNALTDEEKTRACNWIGATKLWKHTIEIGDGHLIVFTTSKIPYTKDNIGTIGSDYIFAKYGDCQVTQLRSFNGYLHFGVIWETGLTNEFVYNLDDYTMTDTVTEL